MAIRASFLLQLKLAGVPAPEPEYAFALPDRKWRLDLAWPQFMVAAEREGGVWTGGRHIQPSGFLKDIEKYNEASVMGWLLVRFTPQMERNGEALAIVRRALDARAAFARRQEV